MFYHKVKEIKDQDKKVYDIDLVERKYFRDKVRVSMGISIEDEEAAKTMVKMLDVAFKNGQNSMKELN